MIERENNQLIPAVNFASEKESLAKRQRKEFMSGAWILVLGILFTSGVPWLRFTDFVERNYIMRGDRSGVPNITEIGKSVSGDEYQRLSSLALLRSYVRKSYVEGCLAAIGMALSIAVSITYWKKSTQYAFMNLWMTLLWQMGHLLFAVYIGMRSSNLFDPPRSVVPWNTFDEYLHASTVFSFGWLAVHGVIVMPISVYVQRRLAKTQETTTNS